MHLLFSFSYFCSRTGPAISSRRPIRIVPDWTENAIQGEHYWKPTSASGDLCCLNEECIVSRYRTNSTDVTLGISGPSPENILIKIIDFFYQTSGQMRHLIGSCYRNPAKFRFSISLGYLAK